MTTHLTKIWWDSSKHKMVEQVISEAEIYKREWVGLTDEEIGTLTVFPGLFHVETPLLAEYIRAIEAKLKERNT